VVPSQAITVSGSPQPASPRVAILLGLGHQPHYLRTLLNSVSAQSHTNWQLWASVDAAHAACRTILAAYQAQWGRQRLALLDGPAEGYRANYMALVCNPGVSADYYAYADQDDLWEVDKLERALQWLKTVPADIPALYCARGHWVDGDNQSQGLVALSRHAPSFSHALTQNIASGNTMVFNQAARALLCQAGADQLVAAHDWWTYLLVTACGGRVRYDSYPVLRQRHRSACAIQPAALPASSWARWSLLWQGQAKRWNDAHIIALRQMHAHLTPVNRKIFADFVIARSSPLLARLGGLRRAGVFRLAPPDRLGLIAATVLNKI
jgi:glycosyltransferase involved in cell wall biosynthesis